MLQIEVGVQRTPGEDDDRGEPRGKPHTSLAMSPGSQSPQFSSVAQWGANITKPISNQAACLSTRVIH